VYSSQTSDSRMAGVLEWDRDAAVDVFRLLPYIT
jgi:hypothetical protein